MGKRSEDEIRQKLVELEVAMRQEQAVKAAEDELVVDDDEDDVITTSVTRVEEQIKNKEKKGKAKGSVGKASKKGSAVGSATGTGSAVGKKLGQIAKGESSTADLYQVGGVASLAVGFLIMLSHIRVGLTWSAFGGAGGLVLLPVFVGIGMLIYNYKSKVAQGITVASLLMVIVGVFSNMTLGFFGLSLLDLIILALPLVCGVVLLAKANVKRREDNGDIKLIE